MAAGVRWTMTPWGKGWQVKGTVTSRGAEAIPSRPPEQTSRPVGDESALPGREHSGNQLSWSLQPDGPDEVHTGVDGGPMTATAAADDGVVASTESMNVGTGDQPTASRGDRSERTVDLSHRGIRSRGCDIPFCEPQPPADGRNQTQNEPQPHSVNLNPPPAAETRHRTIRGTRYPVLTEARGRGGCRAPPD